MFVVVVVAGVLLFSEVLKGLLLLSLALPVLQSFFFLVAPVAVVVAVVVVVVVIVQLLGFL